MIATEKCKVTGGKPSKGDMEGVAYDFFEVSIEQAYDPENGVGTATVPYKFGKSGNFSRFANLKFPIVADVDFLTTTNGRGSAKRIVTDIRVISESGK